MSDDPTNREILTTLVQFAQTTGDGFDRIDATLARHSRMLADHSRALNRHERELENINGRLGER